jgi:aminoglycoside phosphotransferase (APT) family kinase protein
MTDTAGEGGETDKGDRSGKGDGPVGGGSREDGEAGERGRSSASGGAHQGGRSGEGGAHNGGGSREGGGTGEGIVRAVVREVFGGGASVAFSARLPGGASRETWALDVLDGGERHELILRLDSPGAALEAGSGLPEEATLMRAAAEAGVPVPGIVASGSAGTSGTSSTSGTSAEEGAPDASAEARAPASGEVSAPASAEAPAPSASVQARAPGASAEAGVPVAEGGGSVGSYILMERVAGETIPRRILRDVAYADARPRLAAQCGEALAAIHRMPLSALPSADAPSDPLRQWRDVLDATGEPHPVFELAFRRLAATRPPSSEPTVVHGDFRNGNLIVGPEGVRAVLDWELAHAGDPIEDLGWLCVKAWRFGSPLPVGGFGGYDDLVSAYEKAGGRPVDRDALRWWETFGVLKWGIICVMQTMRHLRGGARSVELAAIGRRVCENEWDLLRLLV